MDIWSARSAARSPCCHCAQTLLLQHRTLTSLHLSCFPAPKGALSKRSFSWSCLCSIKRITVWNSLSVVALVLDLGLSRRTWVSLSNLLHSPLWHWFLLSQPFQGMTGLDPVSSMRLDSLFGFTGCCCE